MASTLTLTPGETHWLVETVPALTHWPPDGCEDAMDGVPAHLRDEGSCGPLFRLRLIALYRVYEETGRLDLPLALSLEELWLLDSICAVFGPAQYFKLSADTEDRLITLQNKIWDQLFEVYRGLDLLPAAEPSSLFDSITELLREKNDE